MVSKQRSVTLITHLRKCSLHKTALLFSGQSDIVAARFNDRKAWMARVVSIKYYINHIYRAFFSIFSNAKAGGNKAIGECINEF